LHTSFTGLALFGCETIDSSIHYRSCKLAVKKMNYYHLLFYKVNYAPSFVIALFLTQQMDENRKRPNVAGQE